MQNRRNPYFDYGTSEPLINCTGMFCFNYHENLHDYLENLKLAAERHVIDLMQFIHWFKILFIARVQDSNLLIRVNLSSFPKACAKFGIKVRHLLFYKFLFDRSYHLI